MHPLHTLIVAMIVLLPQIMFPQDGNDKYPPPGFVYIHAIIPDIEYEIRYAGSNNFLGEPVRGYKNAVALLTTEAAEALKQVQQDLQARGYCLKIFDGYRPQQAVDHFVAWAKDPNATAMKQEFYPNVKKENLFEEDYIAARSGHTRGSTVDLTLIDYSTNEELDMGSPYDFFGEISHHDAPDISPQQEKNRMILKDAMEKYGFRPLSTEWWHYTLNNEPYPDTYFNFPVK